MFHVALVALLFLLLLVWDGGATATTRTRSRHADRWLVAAAGVYGVAVANHSLALLLPPGIGLFVLAADWRVILRWRTIVACVAVLVGTIVVLFAGAADPRGHARARSSTATRTPGAASCTWSWPSSSAAASSIRSATSATKAAQSSNLMAGWLGPLGLRWPSSASARAWSGGRATCS